MSSFLCKIGVHDYGEHLETDKYEVHSSGRWGYHPVWGYCKRCGRCRYRGISLKWDYYNNETDMLEAHPGVMFDEPIGRR